MSCPKHDDISACMDDMLAPAERERFMRHLHDCPLCRGRLDELNELRRDLRALPTPTLGFDLSARLEERMRRKPASPSRFGWWPTGAAAALSLASGVWLGGMLIGGGAAGVPTLGIASVFNPVPPGGLCAAAELCRLPKGMP
jgi:anti-sigma factor RsiW